MAEERKLHGDSVEELDAWLNDPKWEKYAPRKNTESAEKTAPMSAIETLTAPPKEEPSVAEAPVQTLTYEFAAKTTRRGADTFIEIAPPPKKKKTKSKKKTKGKKSYSGKCSKWFALGTLLSPIIFNYLLVMTLISSDIVPIIDNYEPFVVVYGILIYVTAFLSLYYLIVGTIRILIGKCSKGYGIKAMIVPAAFPVATWLGMLLYRIAPALVPTFLYLVLLIAPLAGAFVLYRRVRDFATLHPKFDLFCHFLLLLFAVSMTALPGALFEFVYEWEIINAVGYWTIVVMDLVAAIGFGIVDAQACAYNRSIGRSRFARLGWLRLLLCAAGVFSLGIPFLFNEGGIFALIYDVAAIATSVIYRRKVK